MKTIKLFIDGSLDPQTKVGYGAYLLVSDDNIEYNDLKKSVVLKRFENSSSTKLEIDTFLWSIKDIDYKDFKIEVYTDCQNLVGLKHREKKLKLNNFCNAKGKLLNNHELYKEFFSLDKKYDFTFIKVKGHKKNSLKNRIDDIFNIVDKISRESLRTNL